MKLVIEVVEVNAVGQPFPEGYLKRHLQALAAEPDAILLTPDVAGSLPVRVVGFVNERRDAWSDQRGKTATIMPLEAS